MADPEGSQAAKAREKGATMKVSTTCPCFSALASIEVNGQAVRDIPGPDCQTLRSPRGSDETGVNELPSSKPRSIVSIATGVMREPMLALLIASGIVYVLLGSRSLPASRRTRQP